MHLRTTNGTAILAMDGPPGPEVTTTSCTAPCDIDLPVCGTYLVSASGVSQRLSLRRGGTRGLGSHPGAMR